MRLFAAVVPPPAVLDHVDRALRAVDERGPAGDPASFLRWAERETWHLTLAFYGELPDGAVPELGAQLESAATTVEPFDLRLRGAGIFARRTLWVGAAGDLASMATLTAGAVAAGQEIGARPDDRVRSRPHLTVGRVVSGRLANGRPSGRGPAGRATVGGRRDERRGPGESRSVDAAPDAVVRALSVYEGPTWTVGEMVLVESVPGAGAGGGPLYTPVRVLALGRRRDAPRAT